MTKVRIVTGFTPIPGHPRGEEEYHSLGRQLECFEPLFYKTPLQECWLQNWLDTRSGKHEFIVSRGDNSAKNTVAYHVIQHQKSEWLKLATMADDDAETFVWIDYGLMHQDTKITAPVISDFLKRVRSNDFAIPGCEGYAKKWPDSSPNWRFLGSLMVVPRQYVNEFDALVKMITKARVRYLNHLSWEVNDWADVEALDKLPIRWYAADHNVSQLENYV